MSEIHLNLFWLIVDVLLFVSCHHLCMLLIHNLFNKWCVKTSERTFFLWFYSVKKAVSYKLMPKMYKTLTLRFLSYSSYKNWARRELKLNLYNILNRTVTNWTRSGQEWTGLRMVWTQEWPETKPKTELKLAWDRTQTEPRLDRTGLKLD